MSWDWAYAWDSVPRLLDAFVTTLLATALSSVLALVLGLAIALVERLGPRSVVARIVGMGAEFIRRTPLLIQLYFIFYVGPTLGLTLPALTAGVIALGVHFGTYTAGVLPRRDRRRAAWTVGCRGSSQHSAAADLDQGGSAAGRAADPGSSGQLGPGYLQRDGTVVNHHRCRAGECIAADWERPSCVS